MHQTLDLRLLEPIQMEVTLEVAARGVCSLSFEELAELQRKLPRSWPPALTPQLLKHADPQTLASLLAVNRALTDCEMDANQLASWSVASAPRHLGREAAAMVVDRYRSNGAWGVPVHITPHRSTHSVASTISLGYGIRGPAIGCGGGRGAERDALLTAACLLDEPACEGVLLVCSGWSPEFAVTPEGVPLNDSQCQAVALALVRTNTHAGCGSLTIGPPRLDRVPASAESHGAPSLVEQLASWRSDRFTWQASAGSLAIRLKLDSPTVHCREGEPR